ncbi:MAG: thiamine pyrophosphate-binding protein, partial [Nitrospinaceae bacterium]|nr:thiamine pyrophosphate-binding protein [Nitrospinaceae bacterium]
SGKPGICGAQAIGASNLAAGLRDAHMAHSPVISLVGGRFSEQKYRFPYQEIDDFSMFECTTKANYQIDTADRIPDMMRQAFREATSGNPGPVNLQFYGNHGEIERDIIDQEVIVEERHTSIPAYRPRPDIADVEKVAERLQAAARPIIVAGGGARVSGAGAEITALAEKLQIPILNSTGAMALTPENHPLYCGVPGTYSRSCSNKAMLASDLVLFIGSEVGGQLTHFWKLPKPGTEIIQIGIDANDLGRNYPNSVSVLGDAKVTVEALVGAVNKREAGSWVAEVQKMVADWRAEIEPYRNSDATPMRPERVLKELSDCLPEDVLVVSDTGHSAMWLSQQLWMDSTKWDIIRCAGSLGWGFPASLGAKCAFPDRPVVCFTGDGGYWYHLQEMETAVRFGINSVTVVNNNKSMNQEIGVYTKAYDGNPSDQWGTMWKFTDVNLTKIAEDMGAFAIRVEKPEDIAPAMDKAFAAGRPALVEVMTDIDALSPGASLS